jgi:hypothetical protein
MKGISYGVIFSLITGKAQGRTKAAPLNTKDVASPAQRKKNKHNINNI